MIEVELNQLRHDFTAVSAKLERLVGLVSSCRGPSSRRSPSHSKLPPSATADIVADGVAGALPFHPDIGPSGQQDNQHQNQWQPCPSPEDSYQLINGTGLYQPLTSTIEPSTDIPDTQNPDLPQNETTTPPTSGKCFCFIIHQSSSECMEYRTLQLLLDAHMAIHRNPVAAQLYPRTPSPANLLLLDNDSNPVVNVVPPLNPLTHPPTPNPR